MPRRSVAAALFIVLGFVPYLAPPAHADQPTGTARIAGSTPDVVANGRARLGGAYDRAQLLRVVIGLRPPHEAEEQQFLHDVQTRGNPLYHHFLTADEWNARFAPSPQAEQAVVDWATSQGLTVTYRYRNRLLVDVAATVAALERAFDVKINTYEAGGRTFYSSDRDSAVPVSLAGTVQAVVGLNSVGVAQPNSHPVGISVSPSTTPPYTPGPAIALAGSSHHNARKPTASEAAPNFGTFGDIDPPLLFDSNAYGVDALYNQGHCCNPSHVSSGSPPRTSIAIATSGRFRSTDVDNFAAQYGLATNYITHWINGTPPCCSGSDSFETTLDTEYAIAMSNSFGCWCDTAAVHIYEGADAYPSTFVDIDAHILDDGKARNYSTSWGRYEASMNTDFIAFRHALMNAMVGQGWSLTAATGDCGAYDGTDSNGNCNNSFSKRIQYPSSDPDIVAAGGTQLDLLWDGTYIAEGGWDFSGGGCSAYFEQPSFQSGVPTGCSRRATPDIALNASCSTPQAIYFNGSWGGVCGTSEVAPELAGIFAQINSYLLSRGSTCGDQGTAACSPFGNPNFDIYAEAQATGGGRAAHYPFYDITSGCNNGIAGWGGYCAGTGYDMVTGWGSFHALQFAWSILWESIWDINGPQVSFSGPPTFHWYNTDQRLTWTVSDPLQSDDVVASGVAGFTAGWDGIPADPFSHSTPGSGDSFYSGPQFPNGTSGSLLLSAAGQGCHIAHVRAWDNLGYSSGDQIYWPLCYDTVAPTVTSPPDPYFTLGATLTPTQVPVRIRWAGSDATSGICSWQLQRSDDAGAFVDVPLSSPTATGATVLLTPGTATHRFRVSATDCAGNVSSFTAGRTFTLTNHPEDSSTIVYSNGWASAADANSFGGFVKLSTASGNTAAETFNGHNVAWVARRGPAAGIATVQIDGGAGIYVKLTATSVQERRIVFTRARLTVPGGHTVKVTNLGTGGTAHEVNIDSFLWLS
jgi:hypothetical protein